MTLPHFTYPPTLPPHLHGPPSKILTLNPHLSNLCTGAYIFHPTTHALLLLRRSPTEPAFPNLWEVPGGGYEPMDATLLHSVAREAYEETGLVVTKIIASLGFVEFLGREGRAWRKYNLVCEVETVEGVKTDPVEHDAWGWFGEGEVVGLEVTSKEQRGCIDAAFEAKRSGWGGVEGEVEGGAE